MEKELELVKETEELIDKLLKEGELVVYVNKGEIQDIVDATFKKKMTGMLTGLGLGMIAGYAIFKTFAKRKRTQSEVIVEEVE